MRERLRIIGHYKSTNNSETHGHPCGPGRAQLHPGHPYTAPEYIGCRRQKTLGKPDKAAFFTPFVELQNLTMRMNMRRFTRLTNAFSKKIDHLEAAVALHFMYYNFVRVHQTLRVTPAMEAGVTDRLWNLCDIVALLEAREQGESN